MDFFGDESEGSGREAAGVVLAVAANTILNLGTILMKRGTAAAKKSPRRCWWWLGVVLFISGNLLSFAAMSLTSRLTLLAALQSVQFVSNVIFAALLLKEPVHGRSIVGTIIIVLGNVIVAVTSPKPTNSPEEQKRHSSTGMRDQWLDYHYLAYIGTCFVVSTLAQAVYRQRHRAGAHAGDSIAAISFVLASAPLGTQSNLQCKVLAELFGSLVSGDDDQLAQNAWFIALVLVFCALTMTFWVYRLNMAIGIFPSFIIPTLQVFWMAFCILNGLFYFGEGGDMSPRQQGCFFAGFAVVVFGVFILASGRTPQAEEALHAPALSPAAMFYAFATVLILVSGYFSDMVGADMMQQFF